jgi:malto-oligosyltrehalose trehalohydrolase
MSTIIHPAPGHPALGPIDVFEEDSRALTTRVHEMPFGATVQADGSVLFRTFAPDAARLGLAIEGRAEPLALNALGDGWHELETFEAAAGTRYQLVLPDGRRVPDPASRFQPRDVDGPSEVIAPGSYVWSDASWKGRPWTEAVLYELHVGAFTPEGTFRAAMEKLDHLRDLGITVVEIMPVADFPGRWNWGYDGVLLYAPDSSYGRPEDFKAFVEAAHERGISVVLDVVYNHFGPEGNYIPEYFKKLFTERHKTGWGNAVNYDSEGSEQVRQMIVHNALYWVEEFHLDGLRLDAVHAIMDDSPRHILDEISETLRERITDRPLHLILENERNEACRLSRGPDGAPVHYTAQWNDDMHHVLHTAATNEHQGYYEDYAGDTELLGKAIAEGFAFQGEVMQSTGKPRGQACGHIPSTAFIAFIQNHDQIGNRAFGERLRCLVDGPVKRALAAVYLLMPQTPMLFMGEEWNATQPFPYFCDFDGELADKIREGRRKEFSAFPEFADEEKQEQIPDPASEATFRSAKLNWSEAHAAEGAEWLDFYCRLLDLRRNRILPLISDQQPTPSRFEVLGGGAVHVQWQLANGQVLDCIANLCRDPLAYEGEFEGEQIWWQGPPREGNRLSPWSVRWAIGDGAR